MIDLAPNNPYGLSLATPLLAAAGSLGYGVEVARQLGLAAPGVAHGLGALVTRTTTLRARRAQYSPAISETPAGLLYQGYEQNPGLGALRRRFAPAWVKWELAVIVSVAAATSDELADLLAELDLIEGVAGVELPLGIHDALTTTAATPLVAAARAATRLPLLVKLPGHAPELAELARAAEAAGADALSLIDGLPAATPGPTGLVEGLLYGPALRPLALRAVANVAAAVRVPVVGGGGVLDTRDARALLDAGAVAVSLGSALLLDLRTPARIAAALGSTPFR
jgi:dihydroorotate dehydrogenase (NAD+) catalytic subunit